VAHEAWRAKVTKLKEYEREHKRALAGGDPKETFLAFTKGCDRQGGSEQRAKFDRLRQLKPDWTSGGG
jgi:hypothetical protein